MTPQSSFMIVVPIASGKRDAMDSLLESMNLAPGRVDPHNPVIPFALFDELHSARLLIIEANTAEDILAYDTEVRHWTPSLALLGEVDGERGQFLARLAVVASHGLATLFALCQGFDTHQGSMLSFLQSHQTNSAADYVNWRGRTVRQVHEEARLQRFLAERLSTMLAEDGHTDVRQIRQQLLTSVQLEQQTGRLTLTPEAPTSWRHWWRNALHLISLPVILLLLTPVLVVVLPLALWRLRKIEKNDPDIDTKSTLAHIRTLSRIEDHDVSNQFNVFGDVKPGLFRLLLLKSVMYIVSYAARHIYRRGYLARVRTIHFARWVFLNQNRSMYFASLYDGSLESYMDDFINKVAFGLNLTFSHGVGYPRTRWMIKGGAELEQPFKQTLRRHQLPAAVWYRAHPGLTAIDMARHARIRRGIEEYPLDNAQIRQWLSEI
ncbi:MAG: hypothetical protein HKN42_19935 [Granulosicoccus sp.]|nr:hypothetical protein [Granulosicoccus sp.]